MSVELAPSRVIENGSTPEKFVKLIKDNGFNIRFIEDYHDKTVKNLFCTKK